MSGTRDLITKTLNQFLSGSPSFDIVQDDKGFQIFLSKFSVKANLIYTFIDSDLNLEDFNFTVDIFVAGSVSLICKGIIPQAVKDFRENLEVLIKNTLEESKKILKFQTLEIKQLINEKWFLIFDYLSVRGIELKTSNNRAYLQLLKIKKNRPDVYQSMVSMFKEIDSFIQVLEMKYKVA